MSRGAFFVVEGSGDFPLSMLYFNECLPASELDLQLMEVARGPHGVRRVKLFGYVQPDITTWHSYGWPVVEANGQPVAPRTAPARRQLEHS